MGEGGGGLSKGRGWQGISSDNMINMECFTMYFWF